MIQLLKFIDGPWEKARKFLKSDLDTIQAAINQRWAATFGNKNVLPPSAGGTGISVHTAGSLLVAATTTSVVDLPDVAIGNALLSEGAGIIPAYGQVNLTTTVSGILPLANGGTGTNLSVTPVIGDMLYADSTTTWKRLPMVPGGSILASTTGPGAPQWATSVVLGAAGTGKLTVNGQIAATYTQPDSGVFTLNIAATLPAVTTSTRTGINFDVTTAGSSANSQQGCSFTLEAGYTGSSKCIAIIAQTNVASTGFVVGYAARVFGASAVNIGVNSFVGGATQNIALFVGLNNQDGTTFSSGVSGCIVGTNSTTGSNLIDLYSNVTSAFRVTDAGVVTARSTIAAGGNLQAGASSFVTWSGLTALSSPADGVMNVTKQSTVTGFSLDGTTDGICKVRTRASAADAAITFLSYSHSGAEIDKTYTIVVPVTGDTKTMATGQSRIIFNPAGTLALLTVTLPGSPVDGQIAGMSFTQIITGLTINAPGGATVVAPPTSAAVDSNFRFLYQASSTSWFPCS